MAHNYDIVCFYCDLGRDYEPLLNQMIQSAKKVMPDACLICATPTPEGKIGTGWDEVIKLPQDVSFKNLCIERARFTVSWMMAAHRPVIFTDPDIEFINPIPLTKLYADVGLLWRTTKPDQPVNEGLVLALPGPKDFWMHYGKITVNLPSALQSWWCDQLAFSLLTGVCHRAGEVITLDDARVRLIDAREACPNSDSQTMNRDRWAIHYKGPRKGKGWDKVFVKKEKLDGGKSSPDSASSMDINEGPS